MAQIGVDLVNIPEFQKRLEQSGGVEKVFIGSELAENPKLENLAGVFAAKEAFMKAIGKKIDWHDVWIEKGPAGRPFVRSFACSVENEAEISISHAGEYAMAVVVIMKKIKRNT